MSERKFDHFSNSSHLFPASTNIIVSHIVELFLVLTIDRLSLRVKHSIGGNNTELLGLSRNDLELDWLEIAANQEEISLLDRPICVLEVGDEVGLGEITLDAFNGIGKGKHVDFGEIGDIAGRSDHYNVSESDSKILPDSLVHPDFGIIELVIDERNHQGLFALLSLDENGVPFEDLELRHLCLAELDGRILVV
jgi:hypothetical protein